MCQLADTSLSVAALNSLVSEAVDLVVYCTRVDGRPRVGEVVAVEDLQSGAESIAFTVTDVFSRSRGTAPLRWTGNVPVRAQRAFAEAGHDLRLLLEAAVAR
ncbi:MAG: hypothetical protein ACRDZ9_05925 [Acidimicrobiales bacterium]